MPHATLDSALPNPRGPFPWRGWLGIAVLAPAAVLAVLSGRHFAAGTPLDVAASTAGLAFLAAGLAVRTWATLYVGGRKTIALVTDGPYSLCRHPLYLGSLCIGVAVACFLQSLTFLALLLVGTPLIYLPVIREEERVLAARHPESFPAYRQGVPMLLPRRLRQARRQRELVVDLRAVRNHLLRSATTLLIVPAAQWIALLQARGDIPRLLHLP